MGSKSRIAKHIVPIIQEYIDDNNIEIYIEPFVGGANVIDKIKCKVKIGSDVNKYLIALLGRVKSGGELYESVPKDLYDRARTAFNNGNTSEFDNWEIGNIGFLASYNGRWFDGGYAKSGYEKTKSGQRYRDYYQEAKNNILKQYKDFQDVTFHCFDYRTYNPFNSLIYCDPPYKNTKKYANSTNFNYEEFWQIMREWSKENIVLVSEENAPDDFECIWSQEVNRSIKANDKSKSVEKLFKYKYGK